MKVLCLDIGASSGRFIVVSLNHNIFHHEETYRFKNEMKEQNNHLVWDFNYLFKEILNGLKISLNKYKDIKTLGIDTWGVDYGIINRDTNELISNPLAYRDNRCQDAKDRLLKTINYKKIYSKTGIQLLPFNTIFQLFDDNSKLKDSLDVLLMPDLIAFYLTGKKNLELTNLSTTGLYNPCKKEIDESLLSLIGVKKSVFSSIINPSSLIGMIKEDILKEINIDHEIDVIAVPSHDSASAIASIKLNKSSFYISSGTWSLLGVEVKEPIISNLSYKYNFTNEIGINHSVRFLKNIMGLFIIQEYKKDLEKEYPNITFQDMLDMALKCNDSNCYIDVNDPLFQTPFNMKNKIFKYLELTKQKLDLSIGQIVLMIYESIAFKYKQELNKLKEITNINYDELFIVGGGINATLLNQLSANILNIKVVLGESEATVFGNALSRVIYLKEIKDINEGRIALADSKKEVVYLPKDVDKYLNKEKDYLKIIKRRK